MWTVPTAVEKSALWKTEQVNNKTYCRKSIAFHYKSIRVRENRTR
jgi:hypothetical protein